MQGCLQQIFRTNQNLFNLIFEYIWYIQIVLEKYLCFFVENFFECVCLKLCARNCSIVYKPAKGQKWPNQAKAYCFVLLYTSHCKCSSYVERLIFGSETFQLQKTLNTWFQSRRVSSSLYPNPVLFCILPTFVAVCFPVVTCH